jgi:hypothetical protein
LISEVFEVRTQVDRGLTTVGRVDLQLGLNKNLGCHSRARERYNHLAQLSSERDWYWEQYDSLNALVEALRTDNGWLEYQVQMVRDELLNQGVQAAADASAVDKVTSVLLKQDEALRKAREDLAAMRTVAAEWETELASTWAQLQQDRATLEATRSW